MTIDEFSLVLIKHPEVSKSQKWLLILETVKVNCDASTLKRIFELFSNFELSIINSEFVMSIKVSNAEFEKKKQEEKVDWIS